MHGSQYVINHFDARIPIRSLLTNLKKMLAAKFFSSSHDEDHETPWLQNHTVYKHSISSEAMLQGGKVLGTHLAQ